MNSNKSAKLESLSVTLEMVHALEEKMREQDESDLWHSLRKKKESLQASLEQWQREFLILILLLNNFSHPGLYRQLL